MSDRSLHPASHRCVRCEKVYSYPCGGKPDGSSGHKGYSDGLCPRCRHEDHEAAAQAAPTRKRGRRS